MVDVPSTATARVRQLSRGGGRKNDRIDAAAAACVAALQGDARPMAAEGAADALAVLDERRVNLAQARVRAVNQLHAVLRSMLAGGAPTDLSAATAGVLLRSVRPSGEVERVRKAVAGDLVAEIRSLDTRLKTSAKVIAEMVEKSGSTLTATSASDRSSLAGSSAGPEVLVDSRTRPPTPTTSAPRLLRWPARTKHVTGYLEPVIGS